MVRTTYAPAATSCLLVLGNAGITGFQLAQAIQQILVRRINDRQYRDVTVPNLAADDLFIQ